MDPVSAAVARVQQVQQALQVITVLQLTSYRFPPPRELEDGATFDYVIVGGGTAGCVVASRLTEDPDVSVALIEAGGIPPLESMYPNLIRLLSNSTYDYSFRTEDDHNSSRQTMASGKVLGGSSTISTLMWSRGTRKAFQRWADVANDSSWGYEGLIPYFHKAEQVQIEDILNGPTAGEYGTTGNIVLTRNSGRQNGIIQSFKDLGYEHQVDLSGDTVFGIAELIITASQGEDGVPQNTAISYLGPAKDRNNLHVFYHTTATKILFDDNKNAVGVEAANSNKDKFTINASKEVIIAAGAYKSPQLLLLSGIGPKNDLDNFGIPVIADLPVGRNLKNPASSLGIITLDPLPTLPPLNPHVYALTSSVVNTALDPSNPRHDIQGINAITDVNYLLDFCSVQWRLKDEICNKAAVKSAGKRIFSSQFYLAEETNSTGIVALRSLDPFDDPLIYMGQFTDPADLYKLATYLHKFFSKLVDTQYFQSVGAELFYYDECKEDTSTLEYWKCYVLNLKAPTYHPLGTCAMGSVVDPELNVFGVQGLRVVDASAIPSNNGGKMGAAVVVFAEKAADLIKAARLKG